MSTKRAHTAQTANVDPVARAIASAPIDDEPETPAEAEAVAHARAQAKRGEVLTDAELRRTLGL